MASNSFSLYAGDASRWIGRGRCCRHSLSTTRCYGIPVGPGGAHEDIMKPRNTELPEGQISWGSKSSAPTQIQGNQDLYGKIVVLNKETVDIYAIGLL